MHEFSLDNFLNKAQQKLLETKSLKEISKIREIKEMGDEYPESSIGTSAQEHSHFTSALVNEQEALANDGLHNTPIHLPEEIASHILSVCF